MKLLLLSLVATLAVFATSTVTHAVESKPGLQHGGEGAKMMEPLPVAENPPLVLFAEGIQTDLDVLAFMTAFAETLRIHDGKPFLPYLAENFTIQGFPGADMPGAFVMAISMIRDPEEIIITAIDPQPDLTLKIKTGFKYSKRTAAREFTLSPDHKLISTSLMTLKVAPGQPVASH